MVQQWKYKRCSACKKKKIIVEFSLNKRLKDGHNPACKPCHNLYYKKHKAKLLNYMRVRQKENIETRFMRTYSYMKRRATGKSDHYSNAYNKELISYDDFLAWCHQEDNLNLYKKLHEDWKADGYKKQLTPSIDRENTYDGYNVNNIRWVTLKVNMINQPRKRKNVFSQTVEEGGSK